MKGSDKRILPGRMETFTFANWKLLVMEIASLRQDYQKFMLLEKDLPKSPFEQFEKWFEQAHSEEELEANAMVLSTVSSEGWPHGRIVLLKGLDHGLVFFTNYNSEKGKDLEHSSKASLTFWWPKAERPVRVSGIVEKTSREESDSYFQSRPKASQAGAIASAQSQHIPDRTILDEVFEKLLQTPESELLIRPENWGGYRLIPSYFEFWQGRSNRMHDRLFYELEGNESWNIGRLSP